MESNIDGAKIDGIVDGVVFGWAITKVAVPAGRVVVRIGGRGEIASQLDSRFAPSGVGYHRFLAELGHIRLEDGDELTLTIDGEPSPSAPFIYSSRTGYGHFDGFAGIEAHGWALDAENGRPELELCLDGRVVRTFRPSHSRIDFVDCAMTRRRVGFIERIPEEALDGLEHSVSIRFAETGQVLQPGAISFRFDPIGFIDRIGPGGIEGWVVNSPTLDAPLPLEASLDGVRIGHGWSNISRQDVLKVHGRQFAGFCIPLISTADRPWDSTSPRAHLVDVRVAGTSRSVLKSPTSIVARRARIAELEALATALGTGALAELLDQATRDWLRRTAVPHLLEEQRRLLHQGGTISVELRTTVTMPLSDEVDVIVPVYKGIEETMACIESVMNAVVQTSFRLVVIDDCSPDPRLTKALKEVAGDGRFVLLRNDENLGFVRTVNRGMEHAGERDVVLLNSDTIVPNGWLDELRRVAYSAPNIATVTPLSNRATIFSVPISNVDNSIPTGFDVNSMNRLCYEHGDSEPIDVPTGVGFCMFIRREALIEAGLFDAERWKKGYGEENDFCVRARARGFRNVAATRCFVEHHGSVSFGAERSDRVRENLSMLLQLYPDYDASIQFFLANDPLRKCRNRIGCSILESRAANYVLHVTHNLGGGTETAIRDYSIELDESSVGSVVLRPSSRDGWVELSSIDRAISLAYRVESDLPEMIIDHG